MTGLTDTSAFESFDRMTAKVEQIEAQAGAAVESLKNSAVTPWSKV
jgi:phage shock protein A